MSSFYKGFLLLAVLLGSAATLDEDEGQEKWEAVSLVATHLGQDTADGVPEMPQNFRVSPESSSLVMATWARPASGADVDHYIVSEDSDGKQDTTTSLYYIWQDLEACTKYAFSVRAVTSTGYKSEPAQGEAQTTDGIPPEPRDLHVEEYTYDTVTLAWEHPDTQCDIDHYRVRYSEGESAPLDALASETTLNVTDLLPATAYTFSVYASTSEGESSAATVEQNTIDPVGRPEDLVAEGISSSAINVSWSAPFEEPLYYEVSAPPGMWATENVYDLMYVIEDLKPCQRCFITVTSIYSGGREFSASISGETDFDAPPPPKNCHVKVQKEYLAASWEHPIAECPLGIYNVMWTRKKLWGNLEEESDSINTTGLSHTVYNPPPYHEYTFHIAASIKGIFGSPTACSSTSLESPAGPPVNVSTASPEHGEVRVTWESPEEENGEILKYGIFLNDAANSSKEVSGDVHSATINVKPCHTVGIWVAALNHAGWGEQSNVTNVTVVGDVPPEPRDLHVEEYTYATVTLAWERPDTQCDIDHYRVKYSEGESAPLDALAYETTLKVTDLLPATAYTFSVYASTSEGEGPAATVEQNTIDPVGPPEDLVAEGISSSAINVSWSAPCEEPLYYEVSAPPCMWGTEDVYDLMYVIEGLKPCQRCFITVTSIYSDGREFSASISEETDFDAPPPPNNCHVEVQKEYLAASWEHPIADCPLGIYNVMWTRKKLWGNLEEESDSINTTELSHTVYNPPPYHEYTFHIAASIKGIFGSPTACSSTSLESPQNVY